MNIESILNELSLSNEIKAADIPDIDLYMDQVTTFIENKLGNEKRDKDDKMLTKTMVNNYSKAKILTPSKNKKYNKQQIIQLILIYYLKQVLSINDIHDLFSPMFEIHEKNNHVIDEIYTTYLDFRKSSMENVAHMLEAKEAIITESTHGWDEASKEKIQLLLKVLLLSSQAQVCKRTAEAIIDEHFKEK